ncbi:hypothetical protein HYY71_03000 [Candidatus Woesearchaeota archaeon]|nr:hypothetical protein [Candidatus Woesearchaeota archaeon]
MGEELVRPDVSIVNAFGAISSSLSLEQLYQFFHERYRAAASHEKVVMERLATDDIHLRVIKGFYDEVRRGSQSETLARRDIEVFDDVFGDAGIEGTVKTFDELKEAYLRAKRLQALSDDINQLREHHQSIKSTLDGILKQKRPELRLIIEPEFPLSEGKIKVSVQNPINPADAVLLSYIFTGKVPTGYHILEKDGFRPLHYGQLLVDAFGGDGIILREKYPATFNFKPLGSQFDSHTEAKNYIEKGIQHVTGRNLVVSNDLHIPAGVIPGENGTPDKDNSTYFAFTHQDTYRDMDKLYLVMAGPREVTGHQMPASMHVFYVFRTLFSPEEFGRYAARVLKPLHDDGKLSIRIG